ncbi:hypothetical protein TNCV_4286321 [Trichonephila clavipes]|nr:hypothetical protein TNCV_4286321 [Trichonephila clavipes]
MAQSLVAHAGDTESLQYIDELLDYMVISETWMNCANNVIDQWLLEIRANNNTALKLPMPHCPSTSSKLPVRVSAARGSAIYRKPAKLLLNCRSEIIVNENKSCGNSVLRT